MVLRCLQIPSRRARLVWNNFVGKVSLRMRADIEGS